MPYRRLSLAGLPCRTLLRSGRTFLHACLCSAILLGPQLPQAQIQADAEAQRQRLQQESEERRRQQDAPEVHLPPAAPTTDTETLDLPEEHPCFDIDSLRLEGERSESFGWLQAELRRFTGRCIGRHGIHRILQQASSRLLTEGYITTRIGLPEQDISTGRLRFVLVPGIVRGIRITGEKSGHGWRSAFPIRPGDLLNLRDIEQGLEQMKRLPSQEVSIEIAPGEIPGESDILLNLQHSAPWRLSLSLDDSGLKATGRLQATLNGALDNPLDLNDLLNLSLNTDAEHADQQRGTRGYSAQYSVPWGYWTLSLSDSTSRYLQTVQGINQTFRTSGDSRSREIKLQRLVYRDQSAKTTLQFRLLGRQAHSYIEDAEVYVQRRHTTAAEISAIHRHHLGAAVLDLSLAHRRGVRGFGGQVDPPGHAADSPTFAYRMHIADATLSIPFSMGARPARWLTSVHGQMTRNTLYATDHLAIGNRYSVRGFSGETTLAAERGVTVRNELEIPCAESGLAAYLGLDRGWVSGPSAKRLPGRQLSGAVLGLRGAYRHISGDAFVGTALAKPQGFGASGPVIGFLLNLQF